jgi:hypothetical protein
MVYIGIMIPPIKVKFKSSIKYSILIGIATVLSACFSSSKIESPKEKLEEEQLSNQLTISFPAGYEGLGYMANEDAAGFKKQKAGGSVRFLFENSEDLGLPLRKFNKADLPLTLEDLPIKMGIDLNKVFYYNPNNGMTDLTCNGVVFFLQDNEYKEVLYVNYQSKHQLEVQKIIATIIQK